MLTYAGLALEDGRKEPYRKGGSYYREKKGTQERLGKERGPFLYSQKNTRLKKKGKKLRPRMLSIMERRKGVLERKKTEGGRIPSFGRKKKTAAGKK